MDAQPATDQERGDLSRSLRGARLGAAAHVRTGALIGAILFALAALAMAFGGFLTFIWAAIALTQPEREWAESVKSGWFLPLVLEGVALLVSLFLLRSSRNPALVAIGAVSLALLIFLVVISPYF